MTLTNHIHLPQQKLYNGNLFCTLVLLSYFILFSHPSNAKSDVNNSIESRNISLPDTSDFDTHNKDSDLHDNFSVKSVMQLPTEKNNSWQQLIGHPVNSQQYFARNSQGQIYLITNAPEVASKALPLLLIDFKKLALTDSMVKTLNTFTLHPNFSLQKEQGFATLYTAHTEASNKNSQTTRIEEPNAQLMVHFDGVITEWQLDLSKPNQVNLSSKREVLRVTLPNVLNGIKQLSFNPYIKPGNNNDPLLYFALDSTDFLSQLPLYSGAILRINPEKTGAQSFTIPNNNPFVKNENIEDSFYIVGAQHIKQFIWSDKNSDKLILSHQYQSHSTQVNHSQNYQLLSVIQGGEDWRENDPKHVFYKSHKQLSNYQILHYHGRNAPELHNKLLLLQKQNNQWQLSSLIHIQQTNDLNVDRVLPKVEWLLNHIFSSKSPLQLYVSNNTELLLFEQDTGGIFKLLPNNILVTKTNVKTSNIPIYIFFIVMFFSFAFYGFYHVKVRGKSANFMVRKQYANISLDDEKKVLHLFQRHQEKHNKSIVLQHVNQCQILLDNKVITTVDHNTENVFNNKKDQALRNVFDREHAEKMIESKTRQITITLTDMNKKSYTTCLYLRKGSDRITKKSYYQVIDDLIDWCWLINKNVNPDATENREVKPKINTEDELQFANELHDETPLHLQAAIIRSATHQINHLNNKLPKSQKLEKIIDINTVAPIDGRIANKEKNNTSLVDTELVNALEKLVKLKQQGFLSTEEFSQAKAKLLKDLINYHHRITE